MSRSSCEIPIDRILIDRRLQARETLDEPTLNDYIAVAMQAKKDNEDWPFPPVTMVGGYLIDGHHRYEVAKRLGRSTLLANEYAGDEQDAIRAAVGANANHGLQRSRADVQRAIQLAVEVFPNESYRSIARMVGTSHTTVSRICRVNDEEQVVHCTTKPLGKEDDAASVFRVWGKPIPQLRDYIEKLVQELRRSSHPVITLACKVLTDALAGLIERDSPRSIESIQELENRLIKFVEDKRTYLPALVPLYIDEPEATEVNAIVSKIWFALSQVDYQTTFQSEKPFRSLKTLELYTGCELILAAIEEQEHNFMNVYDQPFDVDAIMCSTQDEMVVQRHIDQELTG